MKTAEELKELKEEAEAVNRKLHELTDKELAQVSGGAAGDVKLFDSEKGFGFVAPDDDGCDVYASSP